ncbi:carbohydrate ABC transporter permease [Paenibacillus eucommiae]|uniref:Multiple sugar transport system permease protein n=1 Tax=Paenibacillus eucommiae TaxID=1355755 RepID=A0ABS4IM04_9BACL|nr:carbohydrate ABC transporter permease [Paenibacillus eucommiae]MBP1988602.1 multiple sugar transport system permease protein [Paenibacillus eucommiae]
MIHNYGNKIARLKRFVLGQNVNDGALFKLFIYIILISISVLYLQPVLYMISTSFKTVSDLMDPTVKWIPRQFNFASYFDAFRGLHYWKALWQTTYMSLSASLLQVISCGITGYAFARLRIPFKNILFVVVLITFLIPPQSLVIPLYVTYAKLHWLNTSLPFIIPAIFAQGLKGSLFIIIFRQFFSTLPKELEESAKMDGAGAVRTFWKIMLPLSRPALLIVFLFAFVWHWNDFFEPMLYLRSARAEDFIPLSLRLNYMQGVLDYSAGKIGGIGGGGASLGGGAYDVNEAIKMAAAFIIILPPLLLYMFAQKYFVEGIERTGIVE